MDKETLKAVALTVGAVCLILFALFNSYILPNQDTTKPRPYSGTPTCERAYDNNKDHIVVGHDTWVKECDEELHSLSSLSQ